MATDVIKTAIAEGHCHNEDTAAAAKKGDAALIQRVELSMWNPEYKSIIYQLPGTLHVA